MACCRSTSMIRTPSTTSDAFRHHSFARSGRAFICKAQQENVVQKMWAGAAATAVSVVMVLGAAPEALAVPQTSACATESCDGFDYSNRDLRKEYYTKGSLKGAKFVGSNLSNISLFGANLVDADFTGADLSLANLGQANLEGTNLTQANLSGAIMSSARFDKNTIIEGADFTDVIVRKDINDTLCKIAKGVNEKTGVSTSESLNCF